VKKIIALTLVFLILLTGIAFAEISKERLFNGTQTITSAYHNNIIEICFAKGIHKDKSITYVLGLGTHPKNAFDKPINIFKAYQNFMIKFNDDENQVYDLLFAKNANVSVVFIVPDGAIQQIPKATKVSLFVYYIDGTTGIINLPQKVLDEWKIVVATL
jgi:hypothetical protein